MTEKHYLEQLNQELTENLGEAIWSFAKIERLTYEYLRVLGGQEALVLAGHQNFGPRLNALKRLIEVKELKADTSAKILELLTKAETLAKKRNAIAHNPWQIYIDFEKRDFVAEIIKYMNQEERIDRAGLEAFIKDAGEVGKNLESLLHEIQWANTSLEPTP